MFENMSTLEVIKLVSPLIAVQLALALYCIFDILRKGVRNLNKGIWIAIVLFVNMVGPISYLILGRKKWEDD